MTKTRLKL